MKKAGRIKGRYGFTLVEVIVSLALLVITSAGALSAIHMANVLSIEAKEMTTAMNDARAVLEQVKITDLSLLPNNTTVNASTIWADLNTFTNNNLTSEQIQVIGENGNSLRQITVTVSWIGPRNRQKNIQFTTLKSLFNG